MPRQRQTTAQEVREERREKEEFSQDVKFLLVVLLLFLFYPVGLVLMWTWTKWPMWVKIVISLPLLLFLFFIFTGATFLFSAWRHGWMRNTQPQPYYYYQGGYYKHPMMPWQGQQSNPPVSPSLTPSVSPTDTPIPSTY